MNGLPNRPGTYLLQFFCPHPATVVVGKAGALRLQSGAYLYVGSAFGPGGLAARLNHHLQPVPARPHWHLDYLRPHLQPVSLWWTTDSGCWEHRWARALAEVRGMQVPLPGLGASDCRCTTHLFFRQQPLGRSTLRIRLKRDGQAPPCLRTLQLSDL